MSVNGAGCDTSHSWLVQKILRAGIYDLACETPLDPMPLLSGKVEGARVLLKREDLQPVFSFKVHMAMWLITSNYI